MAKHEEKKKPVAENKPEPGVEQPMTVPLPEVAGSPIPLDGTKKSAPPAFLNEAELTSMYGDLSVDDISVPRITVLQSLSPEVTDGLGRPGNLFVTGMNRELGKELEIIPLLRTFHRIYWKPITEGGGILCRAFDGKNGEGLPGGDCDRCPNKDWRGMEAPLCDFYENVVVVIRKDEDWIPMALSGTRTKLKAMKDLNTLFMSEMLKKRPLFMKSYIVKIVEKTNKANLKFFTFRMAPGNDNRVLPQEEINQAMSIYNSIKDKNISIQQEVPSQADVNPEL